ncbi:MAG: NAD(+)/NADH kinase [Candidatus Glassbacteria bacterium]
MKLGIVANYTHRRTPGIVKSIVSWCKKNEIEISFDHEVREREGIERYDFEEVETTAPGLDAVIAIGGDGTILATTRMVSGSNAPIFGINVGGLGFLTIATADNYIDYLTKFIKGEYDVQERMMLEVEVEGLERSEKKRFLALNDAVIYKGAFSRIVQLKIDVGEEEVGTFLADGIIISTPTGSTGYSLSSGGPLIFPTMEVIVVTPICPHTLGARPLVIPSDRRVVVFVKSRGIELALTVDGQKGMVLGEGSRISVYKAERSIRLVRFPESSFFTLLRRKLGWIAREE